MKTYFFDVGHGETILIELEDRIIFRDIGRSRFNKNKLSLKDIKNFLFFYNSDRPKDAILSHAHEDHFNGFLYMYNKKLKDFFDNTYVPNIDMKDLNSLGAYLIKYSLVLSAYYSKNSKINNNAKNWLLALPMLKKISKKLWSVSIGHSIKHWNIHNKIIWPPISSSSIRTYWKKFLAINDLNDNFLDDEAVIILQILINYTSPDNENINDEQIDKDMQIINNIVNSINNNFFYTLQLYKTYKKTIDNHSLMFTIGFNDNENLFLSDADNKTVNLMLNANSISNKEFNIIKSSHHGNRGSNALIKNSITSNYVVNSCGPAHNNWKGPDLNYQNVSNNLYCTNWNNNGKRWIQPGKKILQY